MNRWMVVVVMVAGCEGGRGGFQDSGIPEEDAHVIVVVDAPPPPDAPIILVDAPPADTLGGPCNVLTQGGCSGGEKCTWINDQDSPPIGHVGCAPNGTLSVGTACTAPPAGPTGYDECARGSMCLGGSCKQICDLQNGAPLCSATYACTRYAGIMEEGGTTLGGVCDPGCNPITQELTVGGAAACGSAIPDQPNLGCYGYDEFSCAPASPVNLTDRVPPRTNGAGNPYLNGCAPGFIPLFYQQTGSTQTLCTGFCSALEIDNTTAHVGNSKGNATARGKLPTSAAAIVGDGTCAIGKKGSDASSTCKFMWPYLEDSTTGELPEPFNSGPLRDTLGVCFASAFFMYDSDNNLTPDTPYPDCSTLPPRTPGDQLLFNDAADWGCQKRGNSQFTSSGKQFNPALRNIRIGASAVPLQRHAFN